MKREEIYFELFGLAEKNPLFAIDILDKIPTKPEDISILKGYFETGMSPDTMFVASFLIMKIIAEKNDPEDPIFSTENFTKEEENIFIAINWGENQEEKNKGHEKLFDLVESDPASAIALTFNIYPTSINKGILRKYYEKTENPIVKFITMVLAFSASFHESETTPEQEAFLELFTNNEE